MANEIPFAYAVMSDPNAYARFNDPAIWDAMFTGVVIFGAGVLVAKGIYEGSRVIRKIKDNMNSPEHD